MTIQENVSLAGLTTFKLGGAARFFVRVTTVQELREALTYAQKNSLQTLLLGGGSNMLVSDSGFDGLAIKLEMHGIVREDDTLIASAGESWDSVVERAVAEELWGIENLSGIPGSVGAAPVQNIGAYGAELKDTLLWVDVFDIETGEVRRMMSSECEFGYRTSIFKRSLGRYVVLTVALGLSKDGAPNSSYKDLVGTEGYSLRQMRERVLAVRAQKFPDLSVEGTAGSFFLNPVVSAEVAGALAAQYPTMPSYEVEGGVKLSAAWLLDNVLRVKGLHIGGARLFEHQPLVVVAKRGSSASDVAALAKKVSQLAKEKLQIELESEVRIIS